jgi:hypothetical protein
MFKDMKRCVPPQVGRLRGHETIIIYALPSSTSFCSLVNQPTKQNEKRATYTFWYDTLPYCVRHAQAEVRA